MSNALKNIHSKRASKLLKKGQQISITCRVDGDTFKALEELKSLDKDAYADVVADAISAYNIPAIVEEYKKLNGTNK